jgi:hypothetical protein
MVKGMTDLFEVCSLVAALSRHTSHRTNSEATLGQFLTAVLRAGQQTKGAATKVAVAKFGQHLQRREESVSGGTLLGSSPNLLPALAKTFYTLHMPSVIPALLSTSSSSSSSSSSASTGGKAKAERSLLV